MLEITSNFKWCVLRTSSYRQVRVLEAGPSLGGERNPLEKIFAPLGKMCWR